MKYMKRVSSELEIIAGNPEEEELMLQGVRFAFRVHQVIPVKQKQSHFMDKKKNFFGLRIWTCNEVFLL